MSSNDTFFDDICFSGVKIAEEAMAEGGDYCWTVKTSHKGFPDYIGKINKIVVDRVSYCYEEYSKSYW